MATFTAGMQPVESRDKGLKTGALGLASSVVIGTVILRASPCLPPAQATCKEEQA